VKDSGPALPSSSDVALPPASASDFVRSQSAGLQPVAQLLSFSGGRCFSSSAPGSLLRRSSRSDYEQGNWVSVSSPLLLGGPSGLPFSRQAELRSR
jgi:hypothetical protein